jgi:hypothetical protein
LNIGVSGGRLLTQGQTMQLRKILAKLPYNAANVWHIGDAKGVDRAAREWTKQNKIETIIYNASSHEPWALQQRSKRLVDALAIVGGELWAFPVKECPIGLTPQQCKSWKGAGTWGTVAYAVSRSVRVHVEPLAELEIPAWCHHHQRSLF